MLRTVAAVTENARLVVINRSPEPNEMGVPIDTTLELEIVDLGPAGIDVPATRVFVDEELAFDGAVSSPFQSGFDGPLASFTRGADSLRLVLHPVEPFSSLAAPVVRLVSSSKDGVSLDLSYPFTIKDRTAPRLLAAQATAQKVVRVAFDEPVALPVGWRFEFAALAGPAVPLGVVSATVDGSVVELALDTEMTPDVEYEVTAFGVTDHYGNAILAPYNRTRFTGFRPARPPTRRFDLWQMLPKHNRRDDETGDLRRFVVCLQEVTDLLLADVDRFPDIFDIERAPEDFLDCILFDLGNPFPFDLTTLARRKLAAILVEMYKQKGTAKGIRNAVRFFLGIEITAISQLNATALVLGESELGVDWELGPSDRFARYAFNVEVSRLLAETERKQLRAIVDYIRPAHTHFVDLLEPSDFVPSGYWDLGISELGISTALN